jgi:16S rRNA (guanine527-N7)-methyltransferase
MTVVGIRAAHMNDARKRVERRLAKVGGRLSDSQVDQLVDYLLLLDRWNQRMNLTALDDPDAAVDRLVIEPVMASAAIAESARTLVDVGSGGGSPAIPLKIVRPELALTMIEVKTRKSVFLREVVRHLGLVAASVETARFEQILSRPTVTAAVDVISIRAVRAETEQLRLFGSALKPGGQQLWFLSGAQTPPIVPAPLAVERELPLVESLRSRLLVIRKAAS